MNESDLERLRRLSQVDNTDALYLEYGKSLGEMAIGRSSLERVKRIFDRHLPELQASICGMPAVEAVIKDPTSIMSYDLMVIIASKLIADGSDFGDNMAIAALVVQLGLARICPAGL